MARRQAITELRAQGGDRVKEDFRGVGAAGVRAFDRIRNSSRGARLAMNAIDRAARGLRRSIVPMGLAAAAAATGLVLLTRRTIDFADEIAKTAAASGVGTDFLQELRFAADLAGTEMSQLDKGIETFSKRLGEFRNNTGALTTFLNNLDEQFANQVERAGSVEEAFDLIVERMADMENQADRVALANAAFGRSGTAMVNIVRDGIDAFTEARAAARELGVVLDADLLAQAEAAKDEITVLQTVLRTGFQEGFLGEILQEFGDFGRLAEESRETAEEFGELGGKAVRGLATAMEVLARNAEEAKVVLAAVVGARGGSLFGPVGTGIGLVGGALIGLGLAIRGAAASQEAFNRALDEAEGLTRELATAEGARAAQLRRELNETQEDIARELEELAVQRERLVNFFTERVSVRDFGGTADHRIVASISADIAAIDERASELEATLAQIGQGVTFSSIVDGLNTQAASDELAALEVVIRATARSELEAFQLIAGARAEAVLGIELTTEAFENLNIASRRAFEAQQASAALETPEIVDRGDLDEFIAGLAERAELAQLDTLAREQRTAVIRAEAIALERGIPLTDEDRAAILAHVAASQRQTQATRETVNVVDQMLEGLRNEVALLEVSADERDGARRILQAETAARRANADFTDEQRLAIEELSEALAVAAAAEEERIEGMRIADELTQRGIALTEQFTTAIEAHAVALADIEELRAAGVIDEEVAALASEEAAERRLEASRRFGDGIERALRSFADESSDAAQIAEERMRDALEGMEDALVEFTLTGKVSFRDMINSILEDIARLAIRQAITAPLAGALSSVAGNLFSGGGFGFGGGGSVRVASKAIGGLIGDPGGPTRLVDPAVFDGAPRFMTGGLLQGEVPAVLHDGEGVFTPRQMDNADGLFRDLARRPAVNVQVNIINQASAEVETRERQRPDGGVDIDVLIRNSVVEDVQGNGPIGRSIENRFGLQPTAVGR